MLHELSARTTLHRPTLKQVETPADARYSSLGAGTSEQLKWLTSSALARWVSLVGGTAYARAID